MTGADRSVLGGYMTDINNLVVEARKLRYEQLQQNRRSAGELQGEYGRWLVASLLLVHGGSILLLAQSPEMVRLVLPAVFWWLVAGHLLADFGLLGVGELGIPHGSLRRGL